MSWHPNTLFLARHLGGETGPVERWRMRRHLRSCARCRQDWEDTTAAQSDYNADPARNDELLALTARIPRTAPTARPARTNPWLFLAPAAAVLIAVMGAVLFVGGDPPDTFTAKGSDVFAVFLKQGSGAVPLPETCRPGDKLRARFKSHRAFVFIVGVDGSGTVSPLHPLGGAKSISVAREEQFTDGSWVLDGSQGVERFVAVFSDAPLSLDEVAAALDDRPERGPQDADALVIIEHRCQKVSL